MIASAAIRRNTWKSYTREHDYGLCRILYFKTKDNGSLVEKHMGNLFLLLTDAFGISVSKCFHESPVVSPYSTALT